PSTACRWKKLCSSHCCAVAIGGHWRPSRTIANARLERPPRGCWANFARSQAVFSCYTGTILLFLPRRSSLSVHIFVLVCGAASVGPIVLGAAFSIMCPLFPCQVCCIDSILFEPVRS